MFEDGFPNVDDAFAGDGRARLDAGIPAVGAGREQVQRAGSTPRGRVRALGLLSPSALLMTMPSIISMMPRLMPLEFVSGAGDHQQQEEVGHGADCGFALADADGFDDDVAVAGGLAQQHGFAGAAGDAAEVAARRGRADEGLFLRR